MTSSFAQPIGANESALQHADQLLLAIEQVQSHKPHRLGFRGIAKVRDDGLCRLMKGRSSPQLLRSLALDLKSRCPFDDVAEDMAWMEMPAGLLAGIEANLTHVDGRERGSSGCSIK